MSLLTKLLEEQGITHWPSGWKQRIECLGPPGLLSREQDANRLGGRLVGKTATEALKQRIWELEQEVYSFDDDEKAETLDWILRAKEVLKQHNVRIEV